MTTENQLQNEEEIEIDLLQLMLFLLKHWKALLLALILGGAAGAGITQLQVDTYVSQSMLYILSETTSITSYADIQIGSALSADFAVIATSKPVVDYAIEEVEEELGITLTRAEVREMVTVTNEDDTRILTISVENEDAELAYVLCTALTEGTADQMASIMKSDPPTTVESAEVAEEPEDNHLVRNIVIGALLVFVLFAAVFTVRFMMNDVIKTTEDVEKYLDATVLGVVPKDKALAYRDKSNNKKKKKEKKKKEKKKQ